VCGNESETACLGGGVSGGSKQEASTARLIFRQASSLATSGALAYAPTSDQNKHNKETAKKNDGSIFQLGTEISYCFWGWIALLVFLGFFTKQSRTPPPWAEHDRPPHGRGRQAASSGRDKHVVGNQHTFPPPHYTTTSSCHPLLYLFTCGLPKGEGKRRKPPPSPALPSRIPHSAKRQRSRDSKQKTITLIFSLILHMHTTDGSLFSVFALQERGEGHHHLAERACLLLPLVGRRRRGPLVGARVRILVVGAACRLLERRRNKERRE